MCADCRSERPWCHKRLAHLTLSEDQRSECANKESDRVDELISVVSVLKESE